MNIFQVAALGIVCVLFATQLKQEKSEISVVLCIVAGVFIFFNIFDDFKLLVQTIKEISNYSQIEMSYLEIMVKMLGVTYVAEFSSGICKDAGYQTIATQIELCGKISILVLSLPVLTMLLRTIQEFLV
jgi:stage III sporulation protein AD